MAFNIEANNVSVTRDEQGNIQHLEHFLHPYVGVAPTDDRQAEALEAARVPFAFAPTPQALAQQYLREVASVYQIPDTMLPGPGGAEARAAEPARSKLELAEETEMMGTTTISYQQTYNGLQVWEAGVSVTIQPDPPRVTASQSSFHRDVSLQEEAPGVVPAYRPEGITPSVLKTLLGLTNGDTPTINGTRQLIYQYIPNQRFDPEAQTSPTETLQGGPPTLDLPPIPETIEPEQHRLVIEALFTLNPPVEGYYRTPINWRAFIDATTGAVLYLRALVACASGMIFRTDPFRAGAGDDMTPTAEAIKLNPFRSTVTLEGLNNSNPQPLSGEFVQLVENDPPVVAPPREPNPPGAFLYDAPTREFAAVNAYHHCDWLFRHMQGMGFNIATYFDGTTFPVPVDQCAFFDIVNARAPANTSGTGSGGFQFGLAGTSPAVSIAAEVGVVLHEFGHALLEDSVHSPNFGFAHSAGDSLAAILLDPESALRTDPVRRFETFTWVLPERNHGRDVAAGWGWGGANDVGSYSSEQILSTTHFRLYRSLGGDSVDVNRRKLAARQAVYLIYRAIGSLATSPVTTTPRPDIFATSLMNADTGTSNFEGYRGGAIHKLIRWSFEKQGLYQPPGAPSPVTTPGAPPDVDVYINDGRDYQNNPRNGEYVFQPLHWECTDIWNRLAPSTGGGGGAHETPVVGRTNYAYVRVNNRGTQHANNVLVRGYRTKPAVGTSWSDDWTPMDTPQIVVAGGIAPGGSVVVGPFRWRPRSIGHECMLMEVTDDRDLSNIDARTFFPCAAGPTADWQLIPFDNNLAQRNVAPVPGAGGRRGLLSAFQNRRLQVHNPSDNQARVEVRAELPPFLAEREWRIRLNFKEMTAAFRLASGADREITVTLRPGEEFSRQELMQVEGGVAIRVLAYADGVLIGGMTYQLDPDLDRAPSEKEDERSIDPNDPAIDAEIGDAELLKEEEERGFRMS